MLWLNVVQPMCEWDKGCAKAANGSHGRPGVVGYGSSVNGYSHGYMTAACAVGLTMNELNEFFIRLDKTTREKAKSKLAAKKEANA
jgi:hypothetical protein